MARLAVADHLQNYTFWLFDLGPIAALALPLFLPALGFSSISAPEMTIETKEITECNWHWKRKVLGKGSASSITLERGVQFFDADFYRWIQSGLHGTPTLHGIGLASAFGAIGGAIGSNLTGAFEVGGPTYRRLLLLVQFFPRLGMNATSSAVGNGAISAGIITAIGAGAAGFTDLGTSSQVAGGIRNAAANTGAFLGGAFAARLPARAFLLSGCIPTRYKPSGDFDAMSSDVSVAELEIEMDSWTEIGLAT